MSDDAPAPSPSDLIARARALSVLRHVPVGTRVVVRSHIDGGAIDALGDITARSADAITVETRRGAKDVRLDDVIAARIVPPPPRQRH